MRKAFSDKVERGRRLTGRFRSRPGDGWGAFEIVGPNGVALTIMVGGSDDDIPWEHVSVSLKNRCPNWQEMCAVKDWFFEDEETVVQFHPPKSRYVNCHPYCLHLWRHVSEPQPLPPLQAV